MRINPLDPEFNKYLSKHNLSKKFNKQLNLFLNNPNHPSLNTERLEPKQYKLYSFRIDRKYRVVFLFSEPDLIEVVEINDHYR
ncbi:MAG: hypothetical protein UX52_C0018G0017 [Candidatus Amesbacteria bacterium GW2011_GWA1_46_35]|uniref:Toxin YoeB n=1 Tax=Candidatus Amesbacteria bacterium GW2011_GWC2_45_19 TaxID=1618366 RepID=A0A0G1M585_9BACT|nr:MAG: hypothetical protein UX05_C0001G0060 [Candidatus Amesbacteria bacterium GW2011_GWC2_45_19]KKU37780.1 MAG: hypothetical protein UX52_C0018G0017 [Candidatus Amesbacteria bacterium GW2011_GWA1_46_35]KKU69586.1 MAG: hypothetical protein UX93_C0001G0171 [Microgenomates group bacterium GW2011_GWC1_47_20]